MLLQNKNKCWSFLWGETETLQSWAISNFIKLLKRKEKNPSSLLCLMGSGLMERLSLGVNLFWQWIFCENGTEWKLLSSCSSCWGNPEGGFGFQLCWILESQVTLQLASVLSSIPTGLGKMRRVPPVIELPVENVTCTLISLSDCFSSLFWSPERGSSLFL